MTSEPEEFVIELPDDARTTSALGEQIGARLQPGDFVALIGEMGSGKTCLTRGLAKGLGVHDPDAVTSPTYLMVVEHPGERALLVHIDAYLPAKTESFLLDGGLDYLEELDGAVVVVEWADRLVGVLPEPDLRIELQPRVGGGRRVTCRPKRDKIGWLGDL